MLLIYLFNYLIPHLKTVVCGDFCPQIYGRLISLNKFQLYLSPPFPASKSWIIIRLFFFVFLETILMSGTTLYGNNLVFQILTSFMYHIRLSRETMDLRLGIFIYLIIQLVSVVRYLIFKSRSEDSWVPF